MILNVNYVPDGTVLELYAECPECKGSKILPGGADCQACGAEGRHTYKVPVNALALHIKQLIEGSGSNQP